MFISEVGDVFENFDRLLLGDFRYFALCRPDNIYSFAVFRVISGGKKQGQVYFKFYRWGVGRITRSSNLPG